MQPYFEKTDDLTTTQMCIYIDENAYSEDRDDDLIFKYLYQIVKSIAMHRRAFSSKKDYEEFSLMCASELYMRIGSKGPKATPIKSILNYIKSMFYIYKKDYIASMKWSIDCKDVASLSSDNSDVIYNLSKDNYFVKAELDLYIDNISKLIKANINLPYKRNTKIWKSIYLSCLLSILSSLTLSKYHMKLVKNREFNENLLATIYKRESESSIILYHLPESYYNYIKVKCNYLKRLISNDIDAILNSNTSNDLMMQNIITSNLSRG